MLVHICCSVDSHFFLQKLKEEFPCERLIGFFYNPNIHPYSEYKLRLQDVKRSCKKLSIDLIEGEYDISHWFDRVNGFEEEREKGKRCDICFDVRLEISAKKAKELGEKKLTTTLFMSPKKSHEQLILASKKIEKEYNLNVFAPDFRKNGGTQAQFALAKKDKLYHQNYCGCMFALNRQREAQKKINDEMFMPIGREILPNSIEEKMKLYKKIIKYEKREKEFEIEKRRFLNYRLLSAKTKYENKTIPSYILFHSIFKKEHIKILLLASDKDFAYKDEVVFLSLKEFNKLAKTRYESVKNLIFSSISIKKSLQIRAKIDNEKFSLTPIVVLDEIIDGGYEIYSLTKSYEDIREVLVSI
ncbi:MAG: epoxyqueuosine reductase QueH [Campylobacteraceae bacterium]|nr:epoxyqueuosine reductase QueH [Campylobacteraceae bacterium]